MLANLVKITDGYVAIIDESNKVRDRVVIAKASEKLLEIDEINAGFTIAKIDNETVGDRKSVV